MPLLPGARGLFGAPGLGFGRLAALPALPMVSARDWTPGQRVLFLEREKEARDWLEARKEEIKGLLAESPEAAPGYGLSIGRKLETITNCQEVWKRFATLGGTIESFMSCIKLGKTSLKEQVRVLSGYAGKALESDLEMLLSGCVESKASAPMIERLK